MPVLDCRIDIPIANLKDAYESIPMVKQEITHECDACDGDGKFDHYGETYECKTCDETGEVGTGRFETVKDPDTKLIIGEACFTNRLVKTLIDAVDYTKCVSLQIRSQKAVGLTVFELDEKILIGIMSNLELADDETAVTVNLL
jgi:hypothetical protein